MVPSHRREIQARLPSWYRGDVHAVVHFVGIGGVTLATGAALAVAHPAWLPVVVLLVPAWAVLEYFVHRFLLHGARTFWPSLARDHGIHHVYFADDVFLTSHVDVYRVLLRPQDVLAVEVLVVGTTAAASLGGWGLALAVATSANLLLLLYEVLHAAAHSKTLCRHPLARWTARHHQGHHAHARGGNFSSVVPWVDDVFGTRDPGRGPP